LEQAVDLQMRLGGPMTKTTDQNRSQQEETRRNPRVDSKPNAFANQLKEALRMVTVLVTEPLQITSFGFWLRLQEKANKSCAKPL
jgi:hypothetical protein